MLNVALIGLLAGSLLTAAPGDDDKDKKSKRADTQESVVIIGDEASEPSVQSTFSLGRMSSASPVKIWAEFSYGNADQIVNAAGENGGDATVGEGRIITNGDVESTRIRVGAEVTPVTFNNLQVGVGVKLTAAKNVVNGEPGSSVPLLVGAGIQLPDELTADGDLSSDLSVQNLEIFGAIRGRALGVHAGYLLDLGDAQAFTDPIVPLGGVEIPLDLPRSDNRDAINIGVDFDYPLNNLRLFGGIDYYWIQEPDCGAAGDEIRSMFPEFCDPSVNTGNGENLFGEEGDGLWNFVFGTGLKLSFVEFGAAAQIVARDRQPAERNTVGTIGTTGEIGGYAATLSPYLRFSPPSLPASIYIRGEVLDEYNGYGLFLDGANTARPAIGFTAGLAVGFE